MENNVFLGIVLLLILGAEFVNGWTDAPNAIATVVSTKVLSPRIAVLMAAVLNIIGALSGTAVAVTIGKGIVESNLINLNTIGTAMIGIIFWSTLAWKYGLPTSESHALVAGLTGAGLATAGPNVIIWTGWEKVLVGLILSTILGFGGGYLIAKVVTVFFRNSHPARSQEIFGRLQIISSAFMAYGHGLNDGQKFIGAFTLTLLIGGFLQEFSIPVWVILLCATIMGIGTSVGGWRIIYTMGFRVTKLQTYQGFSAETGAASVITLASLFGIPLSTTHTINTSIMGVGASRRVSTIHWGVVRLIATAWFLTFPICGMISFLLTKIILAIT